MLVLGILSMLGLWLVGPFAVPLLFGAQYAQSVEVLMLLAICAPIRFLSTNIGSQLLTQGHIGRKVNWMGVTAVLNVVLNLALIPDYSVIGAVIATIVSEVFLLAAYFLYLKRHIFPNPPDIQRS
jgi:O-antigen/teichoic acid export membrane protein